MVKGNRFVVNFLIVAFLLCSINLAYSEEVTLEIRELERKAESGDAEAMKKLGNLFAVHDPDKAREWLLKLARLNPNMATLEKQADEGDADAQYALGTLYSCMHPLAGNKEMLKWWSRSAEQGNSRASEGLGAVLYNGGVSRLTIDEITGASNYQYVGTPQNFEEAYFWYSVADKLLNTPTGLGTGYAERKIIPEKVSEIKKRVSEWKPTLESGRNYSPSPKSAPDWVNVVGSYCTLHSDMR